MPIDSQDILQRMTSTYQQLTAGGIDSQDLAAGKGKKYKSAKYVKVKSGRHDGVMRKKTKKYFKQPSYEKPKKWRAAYEELSEEQKATHARNGRVLTAWQKFIREKRQAQDTRSLRDLAREYKQKNAVAAN